MKVRQNRNERILMDLASHKMNGGLDQPKTLNSSPYDGIGFIGDEAGRRCDATNGAIPVKGPCIKRFWPGLRKARAASSAAAKSTAINRNHVKAQLFCLRRKKGGKSTRAIGLSCGGQTPKVHALNRCHRQARCLLA